MKTFTLVRLCPLVATFLMLWSATAAQQQDDVNSQNNSDNSDNSLSLPSHSRLQNYSAVSSNQSDANLNSYATDYPVVDTLYKVGPGDVFQILFDFSSMEKQVNPEGNIILNRIGVIHLEGLTLKAAEKLILDNLQTTYKRANCFVNLRQPKMVRIFVTGAVNAPGSYEVPGNYRISDALKMAKSFSVLAQRGSIQLQSGEDVQTVDLRKFLQAGDLNSNPYVTQGCIIKVPFVDYQKPWVTVARDSGSFIIQMQPGETVQDLVLNSYTGSTVEPYSSLLVQEKDGKESLLSPGDAAQYKPMSGARIEIVSSKQGIFVAGAVSKPGYLAYRSDHKVIQYISEAGLLTTSKISKKIEVIHRDGTRDDIPLQGTLQPGDVVYVDVNTEQRFLLYTPILLSIVSLTLALLSLNGGL